MKREEAEMKQRLPSRKPLKSDFKRLVNCVGYRDLGWRDRRENTFGPMARVLSVLGQMPVTFPAFVIDSRKGFGEKP